MKTNTLSLILASLLTGFAFLQPSPAVVPPPDGGYPGFNTAEGTNALLHLTSGSANTGLGWSSLLNVTTSSFNTGVGAATLALNAADSNTAVGTAALLLNTTGDENVAVGTGALVYNDSGRDNAAVGGFALYNNVDGSFNTAIGDGTLFENITCTDNTAIGDAALAFNDVTGAGLANNNTAVGSVALTFNTDGDGNTAIGALALFSNTTGPNNTAIGFSALHNNTEGSGNTAIGVGALGANISGSGNTALGVQAGTGITTADNVICIGIGGDDVANSCFIGNIYSNVQPIVGTDPDSVTITSSGRLGRGNVSSRRYKHDIKRMEKASEALYALKPVSFRYNEQYDATQTLAFGLIAEEVAEVCPDLVGRNPKGEPESVRYDQVNAMLLNEFLKEHRTVQELKSNAAKQEATIAQQQKQIEALTAGLQKVSAQLELNKPAPQTVLNNQ
jgi:hypothetical protein